MANRKSPLFTTAASLIALTALTGCATTESMFSSNKPVSAESFNAHYYEQAMKRGADAVAAEKFEDAAKNYMRAAEYEPGKVDPLIALADVLWQQKKAAESAKVLEHAHRMDSGNATVLRNLGRAYVAMNDPQKAQHAYMSALEIDPGSARTLNGLAISYDMTGDYETAQQHYRAGLALEPNNIDIKNNLAYSLITSKKYTEAIAILEPLVKNPNATERQRNNLALAYGLVGRDADAKLVLGGDHAPAQVERNIRTYAQMRGEPMQAASITAVGRPSFENKNISLTEPQPTPAMAPAPVAVTEMVEPAPAEMIGVPEGSVVIADSKPAQAPAPRPVAQAHPAPAAPAPTPAPAEPRSQPVDLAPAQPAAPATTAAILPTAGGSSKIFLGKFPTESAAREAWIRVWTANSATLSSLVASIEPNSGQMALYAVGSDNADSASAICTRLRQNGVSCGVGN